MFEKTEWISYSHGENAPWFYKHFENEECAEWVNKPGYEHREYGSFIFRREFSLEDRAVSAVMNICGLGFYEVFINGTKPDAKRVLTPHVSDYSRYVRYDKYEIAHLLKAGKNVISAEVCGGWFTGRENYWGWQQMFFGNPRLNMQLDFTLENGEKGYIGTDTENWTAYKGSILRSCIYDGEICDLNLPPREPKKPVRAEAPCEKIIENITPPVRITKTIPPVSVKRLSDTCLIYDFGINGTAVPRLEVKGRKNDTVTLNFSEFIYSDGTLNETSCKGGGAVNTDIFTLTGENDVLQPRFTWHGFRYCMVTLSSSYIEIHRIEKLEIHSDIETTGYFECSNEKINRLHKAYAQTQISCLIGSPLDCNQRGERKGWTGDAAVSAEEAVYNFDMQKLYEAFLADMKEERHPERKTVGIICPNHKSYFDGTSIDWGLAYSEIILQSYARYGDKTVLNEHWDALKEYVGFYRSYRNEDGLLPAYINNGDGEEKTAVCWFGDWCTEDKPDFQERVAFDCGDDSHRQNPAFLANVFYIRMLRLTAKIAQTLGKKDEAEYYDSLRKQTAQSLCRKHYDTQKHIFGSGGQFLQTIALSEYIVPENDRNEAFAELLKCFEEVGFHSYAGIFGVRFTGDVMRSFGREDILYRILTAEGFPGMMNMIANGQTTIAEHLDGADNDNWGSGCHPMFASADASFYKIFAGININRFKKISVEIKPYCPAELNFVRASQKIKEGTVEIFWERTENRLVHYQITLPEGITAEIHLKGITGNIDTELGGGKYEYRL